MEERVPRSDDPSRKAEVELTRKLTEDGHDISVFAGNRGSAVHTRSLFLGIKRYHGQCEG